MAQTDEHFKRRLLDSLPSAHVAANLLRRMGWPDAAIIPTKIRPTRQQRYEYSDDGDLMFSMRASVKQRSLAFTCQEDYPYPTIFIDEVYKVDVADRRLYLIVVLNKDMTHAALIPKGTWRSWRKETKVDRAVQDERTWWVCPKEVATFVEV